MDWPLFHMYSLLLLHADVVARLARLFYYSVFQLELLIYCATQLVQAVSC